MIFLLHSMSFSVQGRKNSKLAIATNAIIMYTASWNNNYWVFTFVLWLILFQVARDKARVFETTRGNIGISNSDTRKTERMHWVQYEIDALMPQMLATSFRELASLKQIADLSKLITNWLCLRWQSRSIGYYLVEFPSYPARRHKHGRISLEDV